MRFSVLLSVYAQENPSYFNMAFSSVWDEQTRKPDQIVLVKDGPLTAALDLEISNLQTVLGDVLTVVELPEKVGLAAALNAGLKQCRYELVARMDTDDMSLSDRFENQLDFMRANPGIDILGGAAIEVDESGSAIGRRVYPQHHQEIVSALWACPLIHPSVIFRKAFVDSIGGYDPTLVRSQDYELWFRASEHNARFANLQIPLIKYRVFVSKNSRQSFREAWKVAVIGFCGAKRIGLPLWKQLGCFFPFFKSLLSKRLQRKVSQAMRFADPRQSS